MLNPIRLINDLFDDEKLSNANLRGFTDNFLIRLAGNNPGGIYTPLITDTTTKYTAFYGTITNEAVKEAVSQGLTIATNDAKSNVIGMLSKLQDLVTYQFGDTSSTYQEFYPYGMEEYHQAKIDDLAPILDRFAAAVSAHLTPVEAAMVNPLIAAFKTARTAQLTVFAEVDVLETGKHADRKALTLQLTFDFLVIASNNIDNPDAFDDYYDPRFLPLTDSENGVLREGDLAPAEAAVIDTEGIIFAEGTSVLLENNTPATVRYYFTNNLTAGPTGAYIDLGPNNSVSVKPTHLGFSTTSTIFKAENISAVNGKYKVKIFE